MSSIKVHHLLKCKTTLKKQGKYNHLPTLNAAPVLRHPPFHLSTRAPVAGLLVGRSVDNTEHVSPDKRQEVFQRTQRLAGVAVMGATEGGVKCHILAVVQHPDEQFPIFHLWLLSFASSLLWLSLSHWGTLPQFKDHSCCKTWEPGLLQSQGAQQGRHGDIMSWGEGEHLFTSCSRLPASLIALGDSLHLGGCAVEVRVCSQDGVLMVQSCSSPIHLVI